ncbi:glycosyltransferase [Xinfangfangia sp. D13-10-4-6]|uniref:glycosyltransferase family 2 protein n=1 Tax=Pseudogemmobacter hezensis TaxID=2737662 RepID=UPI001554BEFD|nr:glycosyltransferase [Pseudogemmobacter hezensis]NPD15521.1 glycosyltransferase [Pseudogemmobacter hezensis]
MRVSIVIRTLNEARHLGDLLQMIGRQETPGLDVETVLIDSGSTDGTVEIARAHGARVTTITKAEFSFGRSLNRGCAFATGDILVLISGHCVPVDNTWLQALCQPLIDGRASYTYGRQTGDDDSNFSERRIFAKYFPETSKIPQDGFFCNNANSALLRSVWESHPFDEDLTGLEDIELAKRLVALEHRIGYVSEAVVFHHHQESWAQVRRRFEREAIALRSIMPEVHLSRLDVLRFFIASTWGDWRSASRNGIASTSRMAMMRYRWNQYIGSWKGNHDHRLLSRQAKERFFYPEVSKKADQDEWLKPLRRTSPDEGQQPKG